MFKKKYLFVCHLKTSGEKRYEIAILFLGSIQNNFDEIIVQGERRIISATELKKSNLFYPKDQSSVYCHYFNFMFY